MIQVPEQSQRILEHKVEDVVLKHMRTVSPLSRYLFEEAYPGAVLNWVVSSRPHIDRTHVKASGDPLAFGETDIEVVAEIGGSAGIARVSLLIEMKVDAPQSHNQGLRYRARARHRQARGDWEDFRCMLIAPQRYLESAYPLEDFEDAGWNNIVSLENIAKVLKRTEDGRQDSALLDEACLPTNSWNKPIPSAAQFWQDLSRFQRALHADVPMFINRQKGAGIYVWPSFYENQLASHRNDPRRKRVQIVHSGTRHVALFIKNVKYDAFLRVVEPLIGNEIQIASAGTAWQSVRISVPLVDPTKPLSEQTSALDHIFNAARELYQFFLQNEASLLAIRPFK